MRLVVLTLPNYLPLMNETKKKKKLFFLFYSKHPYALLYIKHDNKINIQSVVKRK